jgi:hypothetical protein
MRKIVAALTAAFVLAGCSGTRRIDPTTLIDVTDFIRAVEERQLEVVLRGGGELKAEDIVARSDSTSFVLLHPTRQDTVIVTSEILSVRSTGGGGSIGRGLGMGAAGMLLGGILVLVGFGSGTAIAYIAGLILFFGSIPIGLLGGATDAVAGEMYIFVEGDPEESP